MGPDVALVVVIGLLLAGGAGIGLRIGMRPTTWVQWAGFTGVAYMLGICVFVTVAQFLISIGLAPWPALLVLAALALLLFRHPFVRPPAITGKAPDIAAIAIFTVLVLIFVILGSIVVIKNPLTVWDAWSIWTRKAIILGDSLEPFFTSKDYAFMHPDYPIGLPALQAAVFSVAGETSTKTSDLPLWLMVPAGVTSIAYLAPARPRFWVPVVASLLVLPPLAAQTLNGYADVPGVLLVCGAVLAGGRWITEKEDWQLWFSALMIAGAICVKNESMLVGLLVLVLLTAFCHRDWRKLAWAWAIVLFALIPWHAWLAAKGIKGDLPIEKAFDPGYLTDNIDRPWQALGDLLGKALFMQTGVKAVLLAILLLGAPLLLLMNYNRRDAIFALIAALGAMAALLFAYWVSPYDLDWHLLNSSDRVIVIPVAVLLSGVLLVLDRRGETGKT